jgi:hypothetical protein
MLLKGKKKAGLKDIARHDATINQKKKKKSGQGEPRKRCNCSSHGPTSHRTDAALL